MHVFTLFNGVFPQLESSFGFLNGILIILTIAQLHGLLLPPQVLHDLILLARAPKGHIGRIKRLFIVWDGIERRGKYLYRLLGHV